MVKFTQYIHPFGNRPLIMKTTAITLLIGLLALSPASAEVFRCSFTSYNMLGHTQDRQTGIIKSYLGEKFVLNTSTKKIQRGWPEGWSKPTTITEVSKNSAFTAYSWIE